MDIWVDNLPSDVTGNDLREVFESFGRVETAAVVTRRHGDECGGTGFVGMPSRSEATFAVLRVHGRDWSGQVVTATEVRPEDPVSEACGTRCPCRSGEPAIGDIDPITAQSQRQGADNGAGKNGLE